MRGGGAAVGRDFVQSPRCVLVSGKRRRALAPRCACLGSRRDLLVTFSIAAWDPTSESGPEWGVAVASKFLSVGAAVPWVRANAGAVATQAMANLSYGPDGLRRLAAGEDARSVVAALTGSDDVAQHRQVGIVDARGGVETFTGSECFDWAGGVVGDGFCCQGNILTGPDVVWAMK